MRGAAALAGLLLMAGAGAAWAAPMTDAQRAAFRAEVRAYLLDHPEVIREALAVAEARRQARAAEGDLARIAAEAEALFHDARDWTGGDPAGDVTLVTFTDYACAPCGPALAAARAAAAADGHLRLVVKDAPAPGNGAAGGAARFARAVLALAGPEAYTRAQDALFAAPDLSPATLARIAEDLGLDPDTVAHRAGDAGIAAALAANRALMERLDLGPAPAHVLDRTLVRGEVPAVALARIAEAMRRKN